MSPPMGKNHLNLESNPYGLSDIGEDSMKRGIRQNSGSRFECRFYKAKNMFVLSTTHTILVIELSFYCCSQFTHSTQPGTIEIRFLREPLASTLRRKIAVVTSPKLGPCQPPLVFYIH